MIRVIFKDGESVPVGSACAPVHGRGSCDDREEAEKCGVKTEVFKNVKQRSQVPLKNDKSMQNYPLKNDSRSAIMIVWRCDYAK